MKPAITTTIPVRNGQEFILQTLDSLAKQTRRPDRVIVLDNCSTDSTPQIVKDFRGLPLEYMRNPKDLGTFGNFNRCLDFAAETEYLHILHADDCVGPQFFEVMTQYLADCPGRGMAWCLDERIDERNRRLSISGKPDGRAVVLDRDNFLARKAEISNQSFCATLLKTNYQPVPVRFPPDMMVFGDMVYWGLYGAHCDKLVQINLPLAQYRWHGVNETAHVAPDLKFLVHDQWRTIEMLENLRGKSPGLVRRMKLKGMMAVRTGINAKRFRQLGNAAYSKDIVTNARRYTGLPLWLAGQVVVQLRELFVFKIGRRPRHPQNIFS
jgi:hypothetical protein